ncbi:MAG TPA: ATP-binding protein [Stellaceae bacterium]|nr:ATP-binding protein [Stellaceae bacterium]
MASQSFAETVDAAPRRRRFRLRGFRMGLTGRSVLLVMLAVVPALGIQAYNEFELREASEAAIRHRVVQITKQFGAEIGELREGARQLLLATGELEPVKLHQSQACSALFAQLQARFDNYAVLGAADAEGRVFCTSSGAARGSIANFAFFQRAMAKDGLAVGDYRIDPATGKKVIHFATRFRGPDGHIAGVVFSGLDLHWLSAHLKERGLSPTASILIADRKGNIIARLPHPELLVGKNMRKSHEKIMDGDKTGWEEVKGVDGVTRIFGYVPPALPPGDFFLSAGQAKAEAFASIDAASKRGIGLILAGLFAAMAAAWAGGRKFIRQPIDRLLGVTAEWRQGNYEARVHLDDRASEIGRLGVAFNEMADALAARHRAQQRAEEELRRLNATLESRMVELEEANRAKSQFLANVSHEIRTPLNGILGMLELARHAKVAPTPQRFVDTARRSAEALLEIISGVLDLSKIEAGKIELEQRPFDLPLLVEDTAELLAELAHGKGLQLRCRIAPDLPRTVIGDSARLRQILTNLIGNAIKFTETGEIGISGEVVEQDAWSAFVAFAISDTGIGIPEDQRAHIFDAFAQADGSTTRRYGGTGLGLTIAKQLCEMMGGSIAVTSTMGVGSTFRFGVRLGLPDAAAVLGACRPDGPSRPPLAESPYENPDIAGARVLLVEDSPVNLEVGLGLLERFGCVVETATNGLEALVRHAEREFALIFVDCQMPEMDGFETAAEIRRREAGSGRRTPIVALTAIAVQGDRERCLAAGMDDYLTKPFTLDQLGTMLARWLDPALCARPAAEAEPGAAIPPDAAPEPAPIDAGVLDGLRRLQRDGHPDIVHRVVALFLESAPRLLKDLEAGVTGSDAVLVRQASHTLRSESAHVGAALLSSLCKDFEDGAQRGAPGGATRLAAILAEYRRVEAALRARLPPELACAALRQEAAR